MILKEILIGLFVLSAIGCVSIDNALTSALTTSANVRLEPINSDGTKATIKYDYGALIDSNGEALSKKAMEDFCAPNKYKILTSDSQVTGEKRFTTTIVFKCIE